MGYRPLPPISGGYSDPGFANRFFYDVCGNDPVNDCGIPASVRELGERLRVALLEAENHGARIVFMLPDARLLSVVPDDEQIANLVQ